jgi:hypothetical protein
MIWYGMEQARATQRVAHQCLDDNLTPDPSPKERGEGKRQFGVEWKNGDRPTDQCLGSGVFDRMNQGTQSGVWA